MLIGTEDIIRYKGNIEIQQLGGATITGYGEIAMSKETGVVFIAQFIENVLDKFIVGAFNSNGQLEDKRDYADKTEKDFFEAVKYFEELIKSRQPEGEQAPPAVGKFYFFKKAIGKDAYVAIEGMEDIIIDAADIPTVFSPPKTKPLGRLNLKDSTNPKYDPIKAKFALKYLDDKCQELATANNWNLSDFAVYDMTPYEIGDENEGEPPPDEVNPVNPDDIEDEDLHKQPPEKKPEDKEPKKDDKPDDKEPKEDENPTDNPPEPPENEDTDEMPFFRVPNISANPLTLYLYSENIKTGEITNKNQTYQFIVNKKDGNNFIGQAVGLNIPGEATLIKKIKYDGADGQGYLLVGEGEGGPPKPSEDISFVLVSDSSGNTITGELYSQNKTTKEVQNLNQQITFIVENRDNNRFEGKLNGVDGKSILARVNNLDMDNKEAYYILQESEDEDEDEEPIDDDAPAPDNIKIDRNYDDEDKNKKPIPKVNPTDLINALEGFFNVKDLKRTYRKQSLLMSTLSTYPEKELNKLLVDLNLPTNMKKQEFINLIEKETKPIFN
jgi:hypothetical protein